MGGSPGGTGGSTAIGWESTYTATMFGKDDCRSYGFSDGTKLEQASCVQAGLVSVGGSNQTYFGALGDLSTLWEGNACICDGGSQQNPCGSPPICPNQTNCGKCIEVACNPTGTFSYKNDGHTHNESCRTDQSVVVQLLDACPHNHPGNNYWCTTSRKDHVDISCTSFAAITQNNKPIKDIGNINVKVRLVNCNIGLGVKSL